MFHAKGGILHVGAGAKVLRSAAKVQTNRLFAMAKPRRFRAEKHLPRENVLIHHLGVIKFLNQLTKK
jgi:hypothetical protein